MTLKTKFTLLVMICMTTTSANGSQRDKTETKICVLGAGMSGISAAHTLHNDGYTNLVIIEGSDRIGGRAKDAMLGGYVVELGTLWIYGQGSNPVSVFAKQFNISVADADFDDWIVYNKNGQDVTDDADAVYETRFGPAYERNIAISKQARDDGRPDFSARSALIEEGWIPKTALDNAIEYFTYDFEFATSTAEISGKYAYYTETTDVHNDDSSVMVNDPRGFAQMIRSLAEEFLEDTDPRLHLNEVVSSIEDMDSQVTVRTNIQNYTCDYVIVTFSLGVLQHRRVTFNPPLPEWKQDAIDQFSFESAEQLYFQFPEKFWDDNEFLIHAGERRGYYTVWLNLETIYPGSKILQVFLANDEAKRVARLSDSEIVDEAVGVLRAMYPNATVPVPNAYRLSRWENNPLFYGAYTNWPVGYTLDTYNGLMAPAGNIYFAGEYAAGIHYSYIHGAYYSGHRTAKDLQSCIEDSSSCVQYMPAYTKRDVQGCTYMMAKNYRKSATVDDGSCVFDACVSMGFNKKSEYALVVVAFVLSVLVSK